MPWLALLLPLAACSGGGGGGSTSVAAGTRLSVTVTPLDFGDRDQTVATFEVRNSGAGELDYAITVDSGNGPAGWIAVAPLGGSSSGETDVVTVTAARASLAPGSYGGVVRVKAGGVVADVKVALDVVGVQADASDVAFGFAADPIGVAVWNWGGGLLAFRVTDRPSWLAVDPQDGKSAGRLDRRTLALSVDRTALPGGHYSGVVVVAPEPDQGFHPASFTVSMEVPVDGGNLEVTPVDRFTSVGLTGGPFAPASQDYQLANRGNAPLDWTATSNPPWLALSAAGGTLAPGESTTVTASIDQLLAATLPAGLLHGDVDFANVTNGNGDATRAVDLAVDDPNLQAKIYLPPNPTTIAPYTTLFSGLDSVAGDQPIVRWDWDFGDSDPENPRTDESMLVVHRFGTPGTFTVKLTVTDANGCTNSTTTDLVVTPFSGKTFYVSSSQGSDGNDGESAAAPFQTLEYAFLQMTNQQRGRPDRLLLRRGDTWTEDAELDPPTPCLLDAYDAGAAPIIEWALPDTGIGWYGGSGGTPDDWGYAPVLSNLHLRHPVKNGTARLVNAFLRGTTFRGCTFENGSIAATLQGEGLILEECDVSFGLHVGVYSSGDSVVCRRSTFTGSGSDDIYDHQIYFNNGSRWLLEDCVFDGAGTGKNNNAAKLNGGNGVVVRRCEARGTRTGFDAGRNLEETGEAAADHYLFDECVSHHNGSAGTASGLVISWVRNVTVRNCLFHHLDPAGRGQGAIWMWKSNEVAKVLLYNNVFAANRVADLYVEQALFEVVLRNNVFLRDAPGAEGGFLRLIDPAGSLPSFDSDCNDFFWSGRTAADPTFLLDSDGPNTSFEAWRDTFGKDPNSRFEDPAFTDAAGLDFTLQPGSPAIDLGETVPAVPRDKAGVARPRGAAYDAGVFER